EVRRLTVVHFHSCALRRLPRRTLLMEPLSQRSGSRRRPRNYITSMPRLRGAWTGVGGRERNALFCAAYDPFGSQAVKLRTSKRFPVCPRKRTSDVRVYEYTP